MNQLTKYIDSGNIFPSIHHDYPETKQDLFVMIEAFCKSPKRKTLNIDVLLDDDHKANIILHESDGEFFLTSADYFLDPDYSFCSDELKDANEIMNYLKENMEDMIFPYHCEARIINPF